MRRHSGSAAPGSSTGSAGTRDRGSVDHRCTRESGAATSNSSARHTAYVAGAPGAKVPGTPSSTPAARQPPRVCAVNAALGYTPNPSVR